MSEMTFEAWIETTSLPSTAKMQLPEALSRSTQEKLLRCVNAEEIITAAIEDVNRGSVETLETLINQKLKESRL